MGSLDGERWGVEALAATTCGEWREDENWKRKLQAIELDIVNHAIPNYKPEAIGWESDCYAVEPYCSGKINSSFETKKHRMKFIYMRSN